MSRPPNGPPPPYYPYPQPGQYVQPGQYAHPGHVYTYVQTPVMMPVYQPPPPEPAPAPGQPTYVTNYIYQQPPADEMVIDWVSATRTSANNFAHKAVVAGKEGWDSSPLWVIRAHHSGELIPGKYAAKHRAAYIPHGGQEVAVHNFELMTCSPTHKVTWLQASHGQVPVGAIIAGNSHTAEPLYIGRVKHLNSITPGKVHPSHGCCYISFGGKEIPYKEYDVLCKV